MKNIWNTSVPPDEKVKLFIKKFNKFRSLLKTMKEPVKVQIHQQNETVKRLHEKSKTNGIGGAIVQGLAKANSKNVTI